jgi:hypothetical protein
VCHGVTRSSEPEPRVRNLTPLAGHCCMTVRARSDESRCSSGFPESQSQATVTLLREARAVPGRPGVPGRSPGRRPTCCTAAIIGPGPARASAAAALAGVAAGHRVAALALPTELAS